MAVVAALVLLVGTGVPTGQAARGNDPVVTAFEALRQAVAANSVPAFRALQSPDLPDLEGTAFELSMLSGGVTSVTAQERDREVVQGGTRLLAEFLTDRSGIGQISTWQMAFATTPVGPRLVRLRRVSAVNGLRRLELDTTHEFAVKDFAFTATDFRLTMTEGTAFAARTVEGITALVLRGDGRMRFAPADPIERHQLQRFAKNELLDERLDAAFIRLNPADTDDLITSGALTPITPNNTDISRARGIFNQWSARSYNLALGDLSPERWTLLPSYGDAIVDMNTRRYQWLTYARATQQHEDVSLFDRNNRKNISVYASPAKIATRGRFYSEDDDRAFDVEHYTLNVRFDPERQQVGGTAVVKLKLLQHDLEALTLKLAEPLAVTAISEATYGRLMHLRVIGQDAVIVSLPEPQPIGKELTLSIAYGGRLPPQSLTRELATVTPQEPIQDLIPPEPNYAYSNNAFWYPQNVVSDYATARIRVAVPAEYEAVSTGTRLEESVAGVDRVSVFAADVPARYLTTIISKLEPIPSTTVTLPSGRPLTIDARSTPRQLGGTKTLTSRAAAILSFYASIIGDVPYPSFTLLSLEAELPGGHSPAYFAAINQPSPTTVFSWRNDPIAFDDVFPNFYLAHEIAHQWWGQGVGAKNYHDQWISEGLAQYFAYLYAGADRGGEVQQKIFERMTKSVRRYEDSGPIWLGYRLGHAVGDGSNVRAIVYNKSVLALEALRAELGDATFRAGLRRFYKDWRFRKAGTADFEQAFEAESGRPLGPFFETWFLGGGSR